MFVDLHLGEVGVDSEVQVQAGRDPELRVEPHVPIQVRLRAQRVIPFGRADRVGGHGEVPGRPELEPLQITGRRQTAQIKLLGHGRPVGPLSIPWEVAQEVHAPALGRRSIAEGAERDSELGDPTDVCDADPHVPVRVPVRVGPSARTPLRIATERRPPPPTTAAPALTLVSDLGVVLRAGWVGTEHEPVLSIQVGIEDHLKRVGVTQVGIPARVGHEELVRPAVVVDHPDIDEVVVVEDPDLGVLAGELAGEGLGLRESTER